MRAVILAAGEGTRMRPLTANRPKVLLPAGPEPLLHRILRQLGAAGVRDATIVTHYKAEAVRASVGDGGAWGVRVTYADQGAPRGTGHAVAAAKPPDDEPFLIVNGDVLLPDGILSALASSPPGALVAARVDDATAFGALDVRDGRAVGVVEKGRAGPGLANAGAYHAPPGFARLVAALQPSPRGELEVTDALNAAFARDAWRVVEAEGWLDVGRPWDLLMAAERALAEMKEERRGAVEPGATLHGKVTIAEGAIVKAGAYVEGPVYIGKRAVVGPNCYVRPNCVILDDCKVGNAVELKASVLMEGTHVAHLSYVGDSVLGQRVNFGAGTLVANLRHDGRSVKVAGVDTRRRKLGVIVGDDAHTGINTSLNVGVVLPAGATTKPGEVVFRSVVTLGTAP
jgi:bifunctional UDP-N-acetylglucosamine pyrophosphorylase/glucosamine-1-phosphate N-acetyltransferase